MATLEPLRGVCAIKALVLMIYADKAHANNKHKLGGTAYFLIIRPDAIASGFFYLTRSAITSPIHKNFVLKI